MTTVAERGIRSDEEKSQNSAVLLHIGAPLLDISADVKEDVLQRYHLKADDCVIATEEHVPLFQELFSNPFVRKSAGGSAQNTARISKWVLGNKGRVAFAGCIGNDTYGDWLTNKLHEDGVEPIYITYSDIGTGVCACLLSPDGKRSLCTRHGASARFEPRHLNDSRISELMEEADCVFVEGYFLAHSPKVVEELTVRCRPDQILSLSLSAEYICRDHSEVLLRVLPSMDIVLGNEAEARVLVNACGGPSTLTSEEAAQFIADLPRKEGKAPRTVVISRGPEPVIVAQGSNPNNNPPLTFPATRDVVVVDGLGCGDALAGGFLAAFVHTRDIGMSVRAGIRAGGHVAGTAGCDPPSEDFGDLV